MGRVFDLLISPHSNSNLIEIIYSTWLDLFFFSVCAEYVRMRYIEILIWKSEEEKHNLCEANNSQRSNDVEKNCQCTLVNNAHMSVVHTFMRHRVFEINVNDVLLFLNFGALHQMWLKFTQLDWALANAKMTKSLLCIKLKWAFYYRRFIRTHDSMHARIRVDLAQHLDTSWSVN